jgi:hypothetical protein
MSGEATKSHFFQYLGALLGTLALLGTFGAFVITTADAKAQTAVKELEATKASIEETLKEAKDDRVAHERAEAAEHELIRVDLAGTRLDVRAVYNYLLTKERQPQLERLPPVP